MFVGGNRVLRANFGTGAISLNGSALYREDSTMSGFPPVTANGNFTANAAITSNGYRFAGTATMTGLGNYTGALTGHFFGPAADEVGGAFSLSDGSGRLVGSFVGIKDDSLLAAGQPLLGVPSPTIFAPFLNAMSDGVGRAVTGTAVVYSPATASYRVSADPSEMQRLGIDTAFQTSFGPENRVAAQSNASFTVNRVEIPGNPIGRPDGRIVTGRLFNPGAGNTALALTYTSFMDVLVQQVDAQGVPLGSRACPRLWLPFGIATPNAALPRSCAATYSRLAFAQGVSPTSFNVEASGTSRLAANFAEGSFTASVSLTDTEPTWQHG